MCHDDVSQLITRATNFYADLTQAVKELKNQQQSTRTIVGKTIGRQTEVGHARARQERAVQLSTDFLSFIISTSMLTMTV